MKGKRRDNSKLSFPEITPITKTKQFPRYTSILNRPDGDGVGIEELDNLQMEIESLLVDAMQRTRTFKLQIMALDSGDESIPIKLKPATIPQQTTSKILLKTPKKHKSLNSKLTATQTPTNMLVKPLPMDSPIVRNDIPDIFWNSIEPYCAEITENDIKLLDDQIKMMENECHSKIPPLGKHYSLKWAKEDMEAEIRENSRLKLDSNGHTTASYKRKLNDSEDSQLYSLMEDAKKYQNEQDYDSLSQQQQFGPLTQRLISALIEQNLMTPFDTDVESFSDLKIAYKPQHMSPQTLTKQFKTNNQCNQNSLEWNIKKELVEQGILDNIDLDDVDADDEIANEIRKLQDELAVISNKCKKTQIELLNKAHKAMERQQITKKIDAIDMEIKDIFNKLIIFKQTNKPFAKKEKDKAKKLIKDREILKISLDELA